MNGGNIVKLVGVGAVFMLVMFMVAASHDPQNSEGADAGVMISDTQDPEIPNPTRTATPTLTVVKSPELTKIVTPIPTPRPTVINTPQCHPSYTGACLKINAGDYDCIGGSGNGPNYTGKVYVVGLDVFGLDRDGDGIGCE